jgi:nucleotide-binding universal stress UspA family protein
MAKLFSKILCPIDFDDGSMQALDVAARLANESDATLYLMHVVFGALSKAAEESNREQIEKIARKRVASTVRREIVVRNGEPGAAILAAADSLGADLIAMATHGRKGVAHLFLGSVAERIVRESKQPVLIIRPKAAAG